MLKQINLEISTNSFNNNESKSFYTLSKKKYDEFKNSFFKTKENYTYTKKMQEMILNSKRESEIADDSKFEYKIIEKNLNYKDELNEKLQTAKRSVVSIENMSKNIAFDMENQSHQMKKINFDLQDYNRRLESSNSVITKILNRENRNKILVVLFSVTLITFFLFILNKRI